MFAVEQAEVRDGLELAYVRENPGYPLLLVHGWPETMRIWWRNIAPLAAAGFEVIVPDLRGFGASGLAPDGHYDLAVAARDLHALVQDVLGHPACAAVGGDLGGGVIQDLGLRFPGFIVRQCLFNTILPKVEGAPTPPPREARMAADYFLRQGRDADALIAELDTEERRRRYVAEFYGHRFWAAPRTFTREDIDFMTEPFADATKLRASFGYYESGLGARPVSEPPRFHEPSPVATLALYGPEDHVIRAEFPAMCETVFPEIIGPFLVSGCGHFLQWEKATVLNHALNYFFRDLLR